MVQDMEDLVSGILVLSQTAGILRERLCTGVHIGLNNPITRSTIVLSGGLDVSSAL